MQATRHPATKCIALGSSQWRPSAVQLWHDLRHWRDLFAFPFRFELEAFKLANVCINKPSVQFYIKSGVVRMSGIDMDK